MSRESNGSRDLVILLFLGAADLLRNGTMSSILAVYSVVAIDRLDEALGH